MRGSEWYQKLWETKLNELPLAAEPEEAWLAMKDLLDNEMPADSVNEIPSGGTAATKTIVAKIGTWLSYILPAAAMIYGATYFISINRNKGNRIKITKIKHLPKPKLIVTIPAIDSTSFKSDIQPKEAMDSNRSAAPAKVLKLTPLSKSEKSKMFIEAGVIGSVLKSEREFSSTFHYDGQSTTNLNPFQAAEPFHPLGSMRSQAINFPNVNFKSGKINKVKRMKFKKNGKDPKEDINYSAYDYGITAGTNLYKNPSLYVGAFGSIKVFKGITANVALTINTSRSFTGTYTHDSYFRPDSTPDFTFTDRRKVAVLEVPITLGYNITKDIKLSAGPIISLPIKQSEIKLGPIQLPRDTIFNGNKVESIIANTKPNAVNYGFKVGIGLQLKAFELNLNYQTLRPYEFKNSLGTNKFPYKSLQIGISYRISKLESVPRLKI